MSTLITNVKAEDVEKIAEIYDRYCKKEFALPTPYSTLGDAVVKNSAGEVIAYGVLEIFAEALLVLNRERTLREKAEAVTKLIHAAKKQARKINVSALYIFSRDPEWSSILKSHFGFVTCEGETLMLRI